MTKIILNVVFTIIVFAGNCGNPCDRYRKLACKNKNSVACHEAMQAVPEMSASECSEHLAILKSKQFVK